MTAWKAPTLLLQSLPGEGRGGGQGCTSCVEGSAHLPIRQVLSILGLAREPRPLHLSVSGPGLALRVGDAW